MRHPMEALSTASVCLYRVANFSPLIVRHQKICSQMMQKNTKNPQQKKTKNFQQRMMQNFSLQVELDAC